MEAMRRLNESRPTSSSPVGVPTPRNSVRHASGEGGARVQRSRIQFDGCDVRSCRQSPRGQREGPTHKRPGLPADSLLRT
jgi:hypothetical protein